MSNPAYLLADLLESWAVPQDQVVQNMRSDHNPDSVAFWQAHGQAVRWLLDVERYLNGLDAMSVDATLFRESLPAWYRAIFVPDIGWAQATGGTNHLLDRRDLRLLRAVGAQMDTTQFTSSLDPGRVDELRTALESAEHLTRTTVGLSNATRTYLLGLIGEALATLSSMDVVGEASVRSVMFELGGAMTMLADRLPDGDEKTNWSDTARALLNRVAWSATNSAISAGVGAAVGAITAAN